MIEWICVNPHTYKIGERTDKKKKSVNGQLLSCFALISIYKDRAARTTGYNSSVHGKHMKKRIGIAVVTAADC